jgi:arylsulfatase A-like enzyme
MGMTHMPRNVVVVLMDSLNRRLVEPYGGREFETPQLARFARRAVRFDRHFTGSLPCIPARHDLLCGALDFLWRPWGSIEVWEEPITFHLRERGVATVLVSDHPHLFEVGGENYHAHFRAWEYLRGHESDPWRTRPDPTWLGAPALPAVASDHRELGYDVSRTWFRDEADFPGPRTMAAAARWLEDHGPHHDRFFLLVDEFDPHEPFDTPEPWASRYDPGWEGPKLIWPPYAVDAVARGKLDERAGRHIRANYGAKLSMIDHWFGRILDALDRAGLWDDTAVIVCTDHGHYLGERDIWGKPPVPIYDTMGHIPLLVAWPGRPAGECDALTTTVDLFATIADVFGVELGEDGKGRQGGEVEHRTHGRSLVPLLEGTATAVREWALTGIWGREVQVTDGRITYARAPVEGNRPLSMWSNRWSTMPVSGAPELRLPRPDRRARLDAMPGSDVPVIRQPFGPDDPGPFWCWGRFAGDQLFDLVDDPSQERNLAGGPEAKEAIELLRTALSEVEAPDEQIARLGLG